MKTIAQSAWAWKLSILKCGFYVFIGMGTIWCATVQSWDPEFVAGLQWYNWSFILVSMFVGACKDIMSFMDKTHTAVGEDIKRDDATK